MSNNDELCEEIKAGMFSMTDPATGKVITPSIKVVNSENERDTYPDIFDDFTEAVAQFKAYVAKGLTSCIHCVEPDEFEIEQGYPPMWWVFEQEEDMLVQVTYSTPAKITLKALIDGGYTTEQAQEMINKIPYSSLSKS